MQPRLSSWSKKGVIYGKKGEACAHAMESCCCGHMRDMKAVRTWGKLWAMVIGTVSLALFSPGTGRALTTVFFNSAQGTNLVVSGTTSDTISSAGYLFTFTRDKLFTGGIGLTNPIGRYLRVHWPDGIEAQAVTAGPVTSGARIDIKREDGQPFAIQSFTAQLLANTAGAGAAMEIMPMLNGEDGVPDPFMYDATGYYGMHFTYNTPPLTGYDAYKITLYVDYALMSLTVLDDRPALDIVSLGSGSLQIAWPTNAPGYTLEYATSLPAQVWNTVTNSVAINGDLFTVELESTAAKCFYRLRK